MEGWLVSQQGDQSLPGQRQNLLEVRECTCVDPKEALAVQMMRMLTAVTQFTLCVLWDGRVILHLQRHMSNNNNSQAV